VIAAFTITAALPPRYHLLNCARLAPAC